MAIKFDRLFALLKVRGNNPHWLRKQGIHPRTVDKLGKNWKVDTTTINALCALLQVQPGEIMEFSPDEPKQDTAGTTT